MEEKMRKKLWFKSFFAGCILALSCLNVNATMLFVMLSCMGIAGFGFAPWLLGMLGDRSELKTAFRVMPVFFVVLLIVLLFESRLSRRHRQR